MKKLLYLILPLLLFSGCDTAGLGGEFSKSLTYIRQGMGDYGSVVYTYDGHYVRDGMGAYGAIVYTYDGHYIRQGMGDYGSILYTLTH